MSNELERELSWDSEIENDGPDFVVLPEGDYDFTVVKMERTRYVPKPGGTSKLPECNQAILHIKLDGGAKGATTITHNLYLHSRTEGLLCEFFAGIGARKKGERINMDWAKVPLSSGRAKVGIRSYDKNGETRQINEIKNFYPYEPKGYTPGSF